MPESDSELMERFRDGDDDAFPAIVQRFQRPLVNFFYRLTWDRFTSEDYAQEVFARLIRHRKSYRRTAKLSTYVFRIAKNYWIDRYRERVNAPKMTSLNASVGTGEGRGLSLGDTVEGKSPAPAEEMRRKEIRERLAEAVEQLPEEQRLVFVLSENQGLKYAEISEVMEIPVGTVKSRMYAAMHRLRDLLKDLYDGA